MRIECWRSRCYERAIYVTRDRVGTPLCDYHAAAVCRTVLLDPIEARISQDVLDGEALPRAPAYGLSQLISAVLTAGSKVDGS